MLIKKFMMNTVFRIIYTVSAVILFIFSLILFCDSAAIPHVTASAAPSLPVGEIHEDTPSESEGCFISATSIGFDNTRYIRTVPGGTYQMEVSMTPEDSNEMLYWRSLDPAVATVDQNGYITALSKGESVIIAETFDRRISRNTVIIVRDLPPAILEVPYINQLRDYPNGCESCSTVMALNHVGIDITTEEFIENYLDMSRLPYVNEKGKYVGASPWEYFLGDPRLSTGLCCYAPVIGNALEKFIDPEYCRKEIIRIYGRALKLRQVSAGGDNSAEMELNASMNVNFDFGRYGIDFVASPRHADGIVITGPISSNMAIPLELCYNAIAEPKIIILSGTDAISGGLFADSPAVDRSFLTRHKVDLYVPGNPPHPLTFIDGVMQMLQRKY